jgi:hypothetical protein
MTTRPSEILCYALKTIEALWYNTQIKESIGSDKRGGFSMEYLETSILNGAQIAENVLLNMRDAEKHQDD